MERWFGAELESYITACAANGKPIDPSHAAAEGLSEIARSSPHLPSSDGKGIFLVNGQRVYGDQGAGLHLEFGSPEFNTPESYVAGIVAMERHLKRTVAALNARAVESGGSGTRYSAYRLNVDYSTTPSLGCDPEDFSTWGFHESWGSSKSLTQLKECNTLPAFLISRILLCGSGGFDTTRAGIHFTLSPRAHHLLHDFGTHSTSARPLIHLKDEPHSQNGHRLHLIMGEPLGSHLGNYLRTTTALVLALSESGWTPGIRLNVPNHVAAMQRLACDPTGKRVKLPTESGAQVTALDLQRHYHAAALRAAERTPDVMPEGGRARSARSGTACSARSTQLDRRRSRGGWIGASNTRC